MFPRSLTQPGLGLFPRSLTQPGLGAIDTTALQTEWQRLRNILHGLAVSISTEKARGNVAGVKAMLPYFQSIVAKMNDVNRQLYNAEFTDFDQFIADTGTWIQDTVQALPGAIAAVPAAIGKGLLQGVWPFALLFAGYLFVRSGSNPFTRTR
jgi:hypothetical protein